ncbi:16579_t:CDS:1 [Acaulospora colombiana]|uniref:16579_t:CDS:1 n=1 Tax=Acaulospora colombiana TaxID=27376 RepID=A0ACA9KJ57_9GLOM|nr:16579_t:CDS:1 [Acaulospora colombiana]
MAAFHIYLALGFYGVGSVNNQGHHDVEFLAWYIGFLIVPVILFFLGILMAKEQNQGIFTSSYLKVVNILKIRKQKPDEPAQTNGNDSSVIPIEGEATPVEQRHYPTARIHLHHWQIFYVLAFFTRFKQPVSQAAGGIVLGIYTEGMVA